MTTFNQEFQKLVNATLLDRNQTKKETTDDENIQDMDESAKSQDFFLDNNVIEKKIYDYSNKVNKFFVEHCICWNK